MPTIVALAERHTRDLDSCASATNLLPLFSRREQKRRASNIKKLKKIFRLEMSLELNEVEVVIKQHSETRIASFERRTKSFKLERQISSRWRWNDTKT